LSSGRASSFWEMGSFKTHNVEGVGRYHKKIPKKGRLRKPQLKKRSARCGVSTTQKEGQKKGTIPNSLVEIGINSHEKLITRTLRGRNRLGGEKTKTLGKESFSYHQME